MNTGIYDQDILRELQSIDSRLSGIDGDLTSIYERQGEILTEIEEYHEDFLTAHTELINKLQEGFTLLAALIVLGTVVKVLFRNA